MGLVRGGSGMDDLEAESATEQGLRHANGIARSRPDDYYRAVLQVISAARILRDHDLDLQDREAMRAALRRAKVLR